MSAGDVKNDTERPKDRENNVWDAESEIRHPKNHKHSRTQISKNVFNLRRFLKGPFSGSTILKTSNFSRILGVSFTITRVLQYFEGGR